MVNEYLQTMTMNIPKICIDIAPFIGEPWRLWFHYSMANCGKFNISYSYAIETEWEKWFYRNTQVCRLSKDNIRLFISNTIADLDLLTSSFKFFDIPEEEQTWYKKIKEHIFLKYNSPKLLINNILKLTNKHFDINFKYDSYLDNKSFELPNIGIYQFIVEENIRRIGIYNEVIKYGNENLFK